MREKWNTTIIAHHRVCKSIGGNLRVNVPPTIHTKHADDVFLISVLQVQHI